MIAAAASRDNGASGLTGPPEPSAPPDFGSCVGPFERDSELAPAELNGPPSAVPPMPVFDCVGCGTAVGCVAVVGAGFGVAVFFGFGVFVGDGGTGVLVGATVAVAVAVAVGVADAGGGGGVTGVGMNVGGGGGGVPADAKVCTGLWTAPLTAINATVSGTASPSVSRLFMQDSLRFWICVRVA